METTIDAAIAPVEKAIDKAAAALPLWREDRSVAVFYLLTVFEDSIRIPLWDAYERNDEQAIADMDPVRKNREDALGDLVHLAFKHCAVPAAQLTREPVDWGTYSRAQSALKFGHTLHQVRSAFDSARAGTYKVAVNDKNVRCWYPDKEPIDYDAAAMWITAIRSGLHPRPNLFTPVDILSSWGGQDLYRVLRQNIRITGENSIEYTVPLDVKAFFRELALSATATLELPEHVSIGGYSVGEFRRVFRALYQRAATHQNFCWASAIPGMAMASVVLELHRSEMYRDGGLDGVSRDCVDRILADLSFDPAIPTDPDLARTDVLFQPLISLRSDSFLLAPTIIAASKWERNLQRLWAIKYRHEYRKQLGRAKAHLAERVTEAFRSFGFVASADQLLKEEPDRTLTDADVAVFDPRSRVLLMAEVKWLVEPSESEEVRWADSTIQKGIGQAKRAAQFVRDHPELASQQLFPGSGADLRDPLTVYPAVIARNHVGSYAIADLTVPIVDYDMMMALLETSPRSTSLAWLVEQMAAMLKRFQSGEHFTPETLKFSLAGYRFSCPGFRMLLPRHDGVG